VRKLNYILVQLIAVVILAATFTGCAITERQAEPAVAAPEAPGAPAAAPAEAGPEQDAEKPADEADEEEERLKQAEDDAKDARKLAKIERDLNLAAERLAQARLAMAHAEAQNAVSVAKAEKDLELERQRYRIFVERSVPNRVERAKLDLTRAEDRTKEAEEELKQLEMMYAEDDFADQTKEIVLERERRRLERAKRDLELRQEEFTILTELTIPLEKAEQETKVEQQTKSLEKAQRDADASRLGDQIGVLKAEGDIANLEVQIEDHHVDMAQKQREREKKHKEKEKENEKKAQAGE